MNAPDPTPRPPRIVVADPNHTRAWELLVHWYPHFLTLDWRLGDRIACAAARDAAVCEGVDMAVAAHAAAIAAGEWGDTPDGWADYARTLEGEAL